MITQFAVALGLELIGAVAAAIVLVRLWVFAKALIS